MTLGVERQPVAPPLRCGECGEPIKPGRAPGVFVHASRVIAACDLDADHAAAPGRPAGRSGPVRGPTKEGT